MPADPKIALYAKAMTLLLDKSRSYRDVAKELGVDRRTLFEWRRDPAWIVLQEDLGEGILHTARHELRLMVDEAVQAVRESLTTKTVTEAKANAVRLMAAKLVFERAGLLAPDGKPLEELEQDDLDKLCARVGLQRKKERHLDA